MKHIHLQPAYVLHRRAYRETSFLIEIITQEHGRLSVVAKGVRKARSQTQAILQPFVPLLISWMGKSELMTLTHVETRDLSWSLRGECLFAGFYLNELLTYLLQKWDPHPRLFMFYEQTLAALQTEKLEQKTLRAFEKYLLDELGYGLLPKSTTSLQQTFIPDKQYRFIAEHGFISSEFGSPNMTENLFLGKSLLAIAKEDWQDEQTLQDAKRLMRFVLAPLLGARAIHSRRLFIKPNEGMKADEE